ncbi:MAG TPA: hypothetical protein VGL25_13555 [Casimicrobiaceae bacterium]
MLVLRIGAHVDERQHCNTRPFHHGLYSRCNDRCFSRANVGAVTSFGNRDHERVFRTGAGVVLEQLGAELCCLNAHDRIDARIEVFSAIEDFDADPIFLQRLAAVALRSVDNKAEKAAQPFGTRERRTLQNPVQLGADVVEAHRQTSLAINPLQVNDGVGNGK